MNPKVSIIVPVYNVEDYLERCLDSLINQTFRDIEVITINGGSTDKSLDILKIYENKDKRIKVIDKENFGVSYNRNLGISEARGEYIVFVDSDDWIELNMIENMYKHIDSVDIVMCTYIREFKNHSKEKRFNLPKISMYENQQVKSQLLRKLVGPLKEELSNPEYLDALGTVWAKMYRKDLLINNDIKFVDLNEIGSGEDTLFNIYAFNKANKVVLLNKPMYHYWRDNPKSITSRYISNFKEKRRTYFKYIKNFIKENNLDSNYEIALNNRICISVLGMELIECSKDNNESMFIKIRNIKDILEEGYMREAYKNLDLKNFKIHWRIFYLFNKKAMALPSYVMINGIEFLRKRIA
ncbi:glycosyltransferase [Clostridium sp. NSJ-6]|uniref:Glycosyltransferase n=1 Tax=Clostridium hominis TaxID=2763036 RepID=A0ABR7DFW9_9CLOT|nr:glycosyltransferase [Clostridium hominis]